MSTIDPAAHARAIHDLLTRFFQAFDDKNWQALRDCLCDEVVTDYSSFRQVPPAAEPAAAYVEQRRTALAALDTLHNFQNLRVVVDPPGARATARCNYAIYRFAPQYDGRSEHTFHSFGHYVFTFVNTGGIWRIAQITQHLLQNQGNRALHGGLQHRDPAG